jgi:hypothetical protein
MNNNNTTSCGRLMVTLVLSTKCATTRALKEPLKSIDTCDYDNVAQMIM